MRPLRAEHLLRDRAPPLRLRHTTQLSVEGGALHTRRLWIPPPPQFVSSRRHSRSLNSPNALNPLYRAARVYQKEGPDSPNPCTTAIRIVSLRFLELEPNPTFYLPILHNPI